MIRRAWVEPLLALSGACLVVGFLIKARPELLTLSFPEPIDRSVPEGVFHRMSHFEETNSVGPGGRQTFTHRYNPERDGFVGNTGLSVPVREAWRSEDFNIGVHSASKSSPAVDESGVYVGSDASWFYAFNLDGSMRWRFYANQASLGIHGTAALDEKYVYIGAYNGHLYCLRKSDGALVWVTRLADAIGSGPVLAGDSIYSTAETGTTRNGYLARLDRRTGRVIWQSKWIGEQVHASPTLNPNGLYVYYAGNNGNVVALSTATGDEVWRYRGTEPVKGSLTYHEGALYFGAWDGLLHKIDARTGLLIWKKPLKGRSQSSPVVFARLGLIALASGSENGGGVQALRLDTGEVAWRQELPGKVRLLGSGTGVIDARTQREVLWIGCESDKLCALDAQSGRVLQEISLEKNLTGVPTVDRDRVYVALDEGGLVAFRSSNLASNRGASDTTIKGGRK